jgi:hypothetical protein
LIEYHNQADIENALERLAPRLRPSPVGFFTRRHVEGMRTEDVARRGRIAAYTHPSSERFRRWMLHFDYIRAGLY